MLDRPPGNRVQPGHQGTGTPNPGHRRTTEETQTPWMRWGGGRQKTAYPHGGRDRGGHLHRGGKWPRVTARECEQHTHKCRRPLW